jgi:hypothetical protein
MSTMKIAVVGSHDDPEGSGFAEACRALGAECARCRHTLVTGPGTKAIVADRYFLEGFAQEARRAKPGLKVIQYQPVVPHDPETSSKPYQPEGVEFEQRHSTGPRWTTNSLKRAVESDVVLFIGGGGGSARIGYGASALHKPVVPVPHFGGSARDVWESERRFVEASGLPNGALNVLQNPWSHESPAGVIELCQLMVKHNPYRTSSGPLLWLVAALLLLLGAWATLLHFGEAGSPILVFTAAIIISSLIGTLTREIWNFGNGKALMARNLVQRAGVSLGVSFVVFVSALSSALVFGGNIYQLQPEAMVAGVLMLSAVVLPASAFSDAAFRRLKGEEII